MDVISQSNFEQEVVIQSNIPFPSLLEIENARTVSQLLTIANTIKHSAKRMERRIALQTLKVAFDRLVESRMFMEEHELIQFERCIEGIARLLLIRLFAEVEVLKLQRIKREFFARLLRRGYVNAAMLFV